MFQQPRESSIPPVDEMIGCLVLFVVREYKTGINTSFGDNKDAVACDVHCIDGRHGGEVFKDALLFQGALIGSLKGAIGGDPVLGRIGQGVAKPKQNPPYILIPFTEADAALAGPYWQRYLAGQMQVPGQQPAYQAPVQQQAAAPQQPYQAPAAQQQPGQQPAYQAPVQQQAAPPQQPYQAPAAQQQPGQQPAYQAPAPPPQQQAAPGAMTRDAFAALPPEVQELLRQSGQAPA